MIMADCLCWVKNDVQTFNQEQVRPLPSSSMLKFLATDILSLLLRSESGHLYIIGLADQDIKRKWP